MYTSHISENSVPSQPWSPNKEGCWWCRFRKKRCEPGSAGPNEPCEACSKFNMQCHGRGIDRPPGQEFATQVRALMTTWIRNPANRRPSVTPLDLILVTSPPPPTVNYQHSGGTPVPPLFSPQGAHNSHQDAHTAGPGSSDNQAHTTLLTGRLDPPDTGTLENDTQFDFYNPNQPAPPVTGWSEDHFPGTSFLPPPYYDQNVVFSSAGPHDPFGAFAGPSAEIFVSLEQLDLTAPHAPDNRTGLPRGSY
ncbi:hypothetical protein BS47DRAFT_1368460 [Hydnum rufescens UP504]|uniref:Zn(2)-C6 fungal-type domain-containing protein n=1 Tax=Hydnum rufescens UP504 TaxID=1448309 RepID=A0A9P6AFK0_9AGAM|nr:hypothetical protein BS47DRAFT_1368460 [Hydnum rufescens UP504]